MPMRVRRRSFATWGAREAEYSSRRRLIVHAATAATKADPPESRTSRAASCEAPAKTITEKPTATAPPSPWATGVTPATRPNGTTPTSIGATARAPARKSCRVEGANTVRSCPTRPTRPTAYVDHDVRHGPDGRVATARADRPRRSGRRNGAVGDRGARAVRQVPVA